MKVAKTFIFHGYGHGENPPKSCEFRWKSLPPLTSAARSVFRRISGSQNRHILSYKPKQCAHFSKANHLQFFQINFLRLMYHNLGKKSLKSEGFWTEIAERRTKFQSFRCSNCKLTKILMLMNSFQKRPTPFLKSCSCRNMYFLEKTGAGGAFTFKPTGSGYIHQVGSGCDETNTSKMSGKLLRIIVILLMEEIPNNHLGCTKPCK